MVTVHVFPAQVKEGNIVRIPMLLPCVLDTAARSETRIPAVVPWYRFTVMVKDSP